MPPEIATKTAAVLEAAKDTRWRGWSYIREGACWVMLFCLAMGWGKIKSEQVAIAAGLALAAKMAHGHAKKKADEKEFEESQS